MEKVINILTQRWPALSVIKCHLNEKCRRVVMKRVNCDTQFVSLMKRQRSTCGSCSTGHGGRTKSTQDVLRCPKDIRGPRVPVHVSEMNRFNRQISVDVREKNSLHSVIILLRLRIIFSVYCAVSPHRPGLKQLITGSLLVPGHTGFGSQSIDRDMSLSAAAVNGIKDKRRKIMSKAG